MDFLFMGLVFLLMGVGSPTVLSIGVLSLALVLSVSIVTFYSGWFSFVMVLLYVGGMMVIIMYFSTLIPNQSFSFNWGSLLLLCLGGVILLNLMMSEKGIFFLSCKSVESLALYEGSNVSISLGLLMFLFVLMVSVVQVTSFFGAPLRPLG